jgi:hypothetical protein
MVFIPLGSFMMVVYKLFLDDERDPPEGQHDWVIVRSFDQAVSLVESQGFPGFVSFDHDLGVGKTGMDFARWLVDRDLERHDMPAVFNFVVHSQNPIGKGNIEGLLEDYLRYVASHRLD